MQREQHSLPPLLRRAVNADLLRPDQADEVCRAWRRTPGKSLASHLAESAAIPLEVVAHLEAASAQAELADETKAGDPPHDQSAATAVSPPGDTSAAEGRGVAADAGSDPHATIPPTGAPLSDAAAMLRFRKLRAHREGGLGVVSIAEDAELPRHVALKEIRSAIADETSAREQFVFEARVTGALEHPGIVPVYGCGVYQDGRPYYAMRFIEGDDLHAVAAAFHKRRAASPTSPEVNLELRQLLGRIVTVAQVLDYAHSRGVIHRDLKPKNIMVGAYGETLVVDWGLAKQINQPLESSEPLSAASGPLPKWLSGALQESRMGTAKGTIYYMSPEQANGRVDLASPAVDVYGLGATLYHVLAGAPPGASLPSDELVRGVQKGELPPLREAAPWVPRPLEAICSKAMAPVPAHRYGSAGELGRDLERWLADEPVSAYTEPWTGRAARWLRRHRTWAVAAMASLLAISVVMAGALWRVSQARRAEADALHQATQLLTVARDTADELVTAAKEQLEGIPEAEEVRSRLLEQAADSYRKFLDIRSSDPQLREQAGWVQIQLAGVQHELGRNAQAAETLERAARNFRALIQQDEAAVTSRLGLAEALIQSSRVASDEQDLLASETAINAAMAELTGLVQEEPRSAELLEARAEARIQQGVVASDRGNALASVHAFEAALADLQAAVDIQKGRESTEQTYLVARAAVNLGKAAEQPAAKRSDQEVERAYRNALQRAARIFDDNPTEARFADLLGLVEGNLGQHLLNMKEATKAAEVYQQGLDRYQELVARHPRIPRYRYGLVLSQIGMANAVHALGDAEASEEFLRRAVAESDVLAETTTSPSIFDDAIVKARWTLATQLCQAMRWKEAADVAVGIPADLQLNLPMHKPVRSKEDASAWYNAACYLAQMAAAATDPEVQERLFRWSLQVLRTAFTGPLGQAEREYAAEDVDLKPLAERYPDVFQAEFARGGSAEAGQAGGGND